MNGSAITGIGFNHVENECLLVLVIPVGFIGGGWKCVVIKAVLRYNFVLSSPREQLDGASSVKSISWPAIATAG